MPLNPFSNLPTTAGGEGFALSTPGLFADLAAGKGCISLPDDFAPAPGANQLSVIADWQRSLDAYRRRALASFFRELSAARSEDPLPERIERFRAACAALGFECPADLGLLLQQH